MEVHQTILFPAYWEVFGTFLGYLSIALIVYVYKYVASLVVGG